MLYTTGPITDIVYGVEGGMEDWAYGAGWENEVARKQFGPDFAPVRYNCTLRKASD